MSQSKGSINATSPASPHAVVSPSFFDLLKHDMADISLDSVQESEWEVIAEKSKNRALANAKPWSSSTVAPSAWGHSDEHWGGNTGSRRNPGNDSGQAGDSEPDLVHEEPDDVSDEDDDGDDLSDDGDDLSDDSDDDLSDVCDSDASEKSHGARKKNRWLRKFFDVLDSLNEEEINNPTRLWHCPACHDGPGAIYWYRGLQRLMTHARTRGTRRIRLHRELAVLLEEELGRRGSSVVPAGEVFGK